MRTDTDLTVGVILSGGLDSSLTLLHVREMHPDCVALTVGAPGSEDLAYARRLAADLGVPHEVIELSPGGIQLADVREAIRMSELTEYGDIINAVVSVPLFRRVREAGIKVVLTGDGSDELFGGYEMYQRVGRPSPGGCSCTRSLSSAGPSSSASTGPAWATGVEARVPFLDLALVELAMRLPVSLKVRDGQEKWILRQAFADAAARLYPAAAEEPDVALVRAARAGPDVPAAVRRGCTARSATTCSRRCSRDFSVLLDAYGHDLDRAVAASGRAAGLHEPRARP